MGSFEEEAPSTDRHVAVAVVRWLRQLREREGGPLEELDVAAACLSEAFGLTRTAVDEMELDRDLRSLFDAGAKSLNARTLKGAHDSARADLQHDPLFAQFLAAVENKGFFDGAAKGTPLYHQRYTKLVEKYRETSEASAAATAAADDDVVEKRVGEVLAAARPDPRAEAEQRLLRDTSDGFRWTGVMTNPAVFDALMANPHARQLAGDLRADPKLTWRLAQDGHTDRSTSKMSHRRP